MLDSQFFGVPQRRRRVFIVGCLGDWRCAAKILFESESVCGDPPKSGKAGEGVAGTVTPSLTSSGRGTSRVGESRGQDPVIAVHSRQDPISLEGVSLPLEYKQGQCVAYGGNNQSGPIDKATACNAHGGPCGRMDFESETFVTAFDQNQRGECRTSEISPQLTTGGGKPGQGYPAVAFTQNQNGDVLTGKIAPSMGTNQNATGRNTPKICQPAMQVRRLTPTECERLQGFSDGWTRWGIDRKGELKEMADGPRYNMLGNAVTVNVSAWIGKRILEFI